MRRAIRWIAAIAFVVAALSVLMIVALGLLFAANQALERASIPSAPFLTIVVVDTASGRPLSGVRASLMKNTKDLFAPGGYDSQFLTARSDTSGTLELRGEEPIRGRYHLSLDLPGYVPYDINFTFKEPEPVRIALKAKLSADSVASVVRGSSEVRLSALGEHSLEMGFSLAAGRYTTGDEPPDLIFRHRRFPSQQLLREYLGQGSALSSYSPIHNIDGSWTLLVELAVPPGGLIQHTPGRQWCSFHELDRCTFDSAGEVVSLFGSPSDPALQGRDIFCLRTPAGRVAKIRLSLGDLHWALQPDGSSFVGTLPSIRHGDGLCSGGQAS